MKYKGEKCFYCNEVFNDNDDVVVCPKCGTPYHRECYKQAGSCINHHLHELGESWKGTVEQPAEPAKPVINDNDNISNEQAEAFKETLGFDLTKPFMGLDPDEDFEGAKMNEIFTFVKTNKIGRASCRERV